ncbi:hypothetical protein EVG20_g2403 [Dentipellis fragilis]|uniref:Uncharacterized protein n=1 Tax=Dentipellis fragilis TaxID=205917 RepID=A0A4Y9Z9A8_9AGAM|nr:hypothetical protein EVG20_g2403 [Dentipellis fragilis]
MTFPSGASPPATFRREHSKSRALRSFRIPCLRTRYKAWPLMLSQQFAPHGDLIESTFFIDPGAQANSLVMQRLFVNLDYDLPPLLKAVQQDWITSCQNAAVVSALVAAVVAQLISTMNLAGGSDSGISNPAALKALTIFAWSALLLSCSATISALLLIDVFGELPLRAARETNAPRVDERVGATVSQLLEQSGMRSNWTLIRLHWLVSLVASIGCMMVQIILYVWLTVGLAVKIVLLLVTIFSVLPLLFLIPPRRQHFVSSPTPPPVLSVPVTANRCSVVSSTTMRNSPA